MKINIETSPSLVASPCLRIITARRVYFAWWRGRPRGLRVSLEEYRR